MSEKEEQNLQHFKKTAWEDLTSLKYYFSQLREEGEKEEYWREVEKLLHSLEGAAEVPPWTEFRSFLVKFRNRLEKLRPQFSSDETLWERLQEAMEFIFLVLEEKTQSLEDWKDESKGEEMFPQILLLLQEDNGEEGKEEPPVTSPLIDKKVEKKDLEKEKLIIPPSPPETQKGQNIPEKRPPKEELPPGKDRFPWKDLFHLHLLQREEEFLREKKGERLLTQMIKKASREVEADQVSPVFCFETSQGRYGLVARQIIKVLGPREVRLRKEKTEMEYREESYPLEFFEMNWQKEEKKEKLTSSQFLLLSPPKEGKIKALGFQGTVLGVSPAWIQPLAPPLSDEDLWLGAVIMAFQKIAMIINPSYLWREKATP